MATAGVLHLGVLAALTARLVAEDGGGAPLVQVTLVPMPSFDGTDGAAPDSAGAEGGGGAEAMSAEPVRTPTEAVSERSDPAPASQPTPRRALIPELASVRPLAFDAVGGGAPASGGSPGAGGRQGGPGGEADVRAGATSGGGAATLGASAASAEDRYAAAVVAWIERHKRHPGGDLSGIVGVAIALDRAGRLREARVSRSSGSPALDGRALEQLEAMQPFPRPEPGATWTRRAFDVQIDYRLR